MKKLLDDNRIEHNDIEIDSVHVFQQDILLINTLDDPAIGYLTELLMIVLKTAYGVLDKIGLFCNDFVNPFISRVSQISLNN